MLRRLLLAIAAILCGGALTLLAAVCWLEFQPGSGSARAYHLAQHAWQRDPAHQQLYARAYLTLSDLGDGNTQHYLVHRVAGAVAHLAGRDNIAGEQEYRAAQHRPN